MKKTIAVITLFIMLLFSTGCMSDTIVTTNETGEENLNQNIKTNQEFKVGDEVTVNQTKLKINSVKKIVQECAWEWDGQCQSYTKPDNDYFLLIDMTFENIGTEQQTISTIMQFELKTPDGEKLNQEYMLDAVKSSLDGSIMVNDKLKGQIAFDVTDQDYYYFYYKDGLLDDNVKFTIKREDILE